MRHNSNNLMFKRSLVACAVFALLSPLSFAQEEIITENETIEELENYSPETSAIDLSKVVVTAGGFSQEIKSAPASISVVSKADLDNAPFRDVTDALKDVPGVVITGGGASQDISIRGMGSQYTLMLVDGKRQSSRSSRPNSDGSGIEQGWIPPLAAIDRVEVIRGPMSSRYGSDAMGGVINVITKKVADKWGGNIRTDYTIQHNSDEGNGSNSEFYLQGPIIAETLGLQIYGKYAHRSEDKIVDAYKQQDIQNIGGKLTFAPVQGQTFELEGGISKQKRFGHVYKSIAEFAKNGKTRNTDSSQKYSRDNISLRYLGEFDNGITSDIILSHEKNDNKSRQMVVKNTEVSANVIIPIDTHTITLGTQLRQEKINDKTSNTLSDLTNISRKNYAFFIEDEWWLLDNFALTGAVRYEHDEKYGGEVTPRLYAVWNIDDAWTLKGGISTGYRAPNLRQTVAEWGQITGGGNSYSVIFGNPDLNAEKSINYEIGLDFTPHDKLNINTTVFYTRFKNKIQEIILCDGNCSGYDIISTNMNVDKADLMGVELSAQLLPIENVKLSANYTYTKTEQKSGKYKGKPLNRMPKHVFNLHADWQASEQVNIWAQMNYRGNEVESSDRRVSKPLGYKFPSYTVFDVGTSYKFNDQATVFAGIYNIANKKVRKSSYDKHLDGRRYWVGISVDF